jgi:hypothetical protein
MSKLNVNLTNENIRIELGEENENVRTLTLGDTPVLMTEEQLIDLTTKLEIGLYGKTWDKLDERIGILEEQISEQQELIESFNDNRG